MSLNVVRCVGANDRVWWEVVHAPSGRRVGPEVGSSFDRKKDAVRAAAELSALGDWSRPPEELLRDAELGRKQREWWEQSIRERFPRRY